MKARHQRMIFIGLVITGMLVSAGFAYRAFKENLLYYFSPTQVADGEAPPERRFRIGGLVVDGSFDRAPGSLTARFLVTDYANSVPVEYTGVLPDLFEEGKGVVAHGTMSADGSFVADEVLAKHDENYLPPEVQESLDEGAKRAAE
jgi:cytochrome c-type biogenesis protein CcmE